MSRPERGSTPLRLTQAGFNVTTADGSGEMLGKAFANGQARGLVLKTVQADWRWLNRDIQGKYDAIICLGNSFTHMHEESDRRRALGGVLCSAQARRHPHPRPAQLRLDSRSWLLDEAQNTTIAVTG